RVGPGFGGPAPRGRGGLPPAAAPGRAGGAGPPFDVALARRTGGKGRAPHFYPSAHEQPDSVAPRGPGSPPAGLRRGRYRPGDGRAVRRRPGPRPRRRPAVGATVRGRNRWRPAVSVRRSRSRGTPPARPDGGTPPGRGGGAP